MLPTQAGKGRPLGEAQEKRQDHPIVFKTAKKDKDKKAVISVSEKAENPELSGLELPEHSLKPQKLDELLAFVKRLLKQSEINCKAFAEKRQEPEAIST